MRKATKAFSNPLAERMRAAKEREAAAQKKNDFLARTQAFGSAAPVEGGGGAKPQPSSVKAPATSKGKAQSLLDMKVNKLKGTGRASKLLGGKRGKKSKAIHCLGINDVTAKSKLLGSKAVIQKVSPVQEPKSAETPATSIISEAPSFQLPSPEPAPVVMESKVAELSGKTEEPEQEPEPEPMEARPEAVTQVAPQHDGHELDVPVMRRQYTLPYDEDPTMVSIPNNDQLSQEDAQEERREEEEEEEAVETCIEKSGSDSQPKTGKVRDIIKAWDSRTKA